MNDIDTLVTNLTFRDNNVGCAAMKELEGISLESDEVYKFFDLFVKMLDDSNSYVRNRAVALISANTKWDKENKFNYIVSKYLSHIVDEKPITARQCIKTLPNISRNKPELADVILMAIETADTSAYPESMRGLVEKDLIYADSEIRKQK